MKIFIASSSSNDIPSKYLDDCKDYLSKILQNNDLIFGAYYDGIMRIAHDIAKENGRHVTGICPEVYKEDLEKLNVDEAIITKTINERTEELINRSDIIIFLPGGVGTMQELFAAIDSKRNNEFNKPIIIYNSNHYFDETIKVLDKIYKEKFTDESVQDCYHISDSADDTLEYIEKRN